MKLKDIPMIYNLDKIKLYHKNHFIAEMWVGHHSPQFYFNENVLFRDYLQFPIDSFSVSVEGCLSEVIVLEIYLK